MRVLIGSFQGDIGTVELTTSDAAGVGLIYGGPDPEHVRAIVESARSWYDRSGTLHSLTDEQLIRSLPYRLEGYFVWAVFVDEATGLTVDQPPYDPWGDVWYYGKSKADLERRPLVIPVPPAAEDVARAAARREWNQRAAEWAERAKARARRQQQRE